MITIKVSAAGAGADVDLSQFLIGGTNTLEDCAFHFNSDIRHSDVWFVLEDLPSNDRTCSTGATVFLGAETMWGAGHFAESRRWVDYLRQFDFVFTSQDLYWPNVRFEPPFLPWMINANHGPGVFSPHPRDAEYFRSLTSLDKPELLSVICSTKTYTAGHRLRLRFVEALAEELGESLHWFGNGRRPIDTKWEAIAPYRFHLVLENQSSAGVFTEKILDAFLGLSYPIYWGAPDLGNYFDPRSFHPINIVDFASSIESIRACLTSGVDHKEREAVLEAKEGVLGQHNLFRRMARIAQDIVSRGDGRRREVTLSGAPNDNRMPRRIARRLDRAFS